MMKKIKKGQMVNLRLDSILNTNLVYKTILVLRNGNIVLTPINTTDLPKELNFLTPYMKKIYGLDKEREYIETSCKNCQLISSSIGEINKMKND